MRRIVFLMVGLSLVAIGPNALAGATLISGLGGTVGYGTNCMPPNDDGSWPSGSPGLDITAAFPHGLQFYTGTYQAIWINNNGNLSFNSAIPQYTPNAFPGAPQPMIAPYWADVDTRNATFCADPGYPSGGGYPQGATCMNPTTNGVWWSIKPGQFVVTWDQVGFFQCNVTPVMSFQAILSTPQCGVTSGMDFDIEFRYNECDWEAGDASGGMNGFCPPGSVADGTCTPAQAGFDSAETPDTNYASLPMSEMSGISTELCTGSNMMPPQPGVWQFAVRGGSIMCPMAGQPCSTGMPGICAQGQIQCGTNGMMQTCVPITKPQPSQCNGLDNTCDGTIDDGPCPAGLVCDGTECVPRCEEGGCTAGQSCNSQGLCVDTACLNVVCNQPEGGLEDGGLTAERCVNGVCVNDCAGVICPGDQVCRLGQCVDPCLGLNCGMGQVCEKGTCIPTCPCTVCSSQQEQTCQMSTGRCVDLGCETVTCPAGQACATGGFCIDACMGAVCPTGQTCQTGMCVATPDAGTDGGGGLLLPDASPEGYSGVDGAAMDSGSPFGTGEPHDKCSCGLVGAAGRPGWAGGALGVGLAAMLARRRRRRGR
jgi:hypothetical protein